MILNDGGCVCVFDLPVKQKNITDRLKSDSDGLKKKKEHFVNRQISNLDNIFKVRKKFAN